MCLLFCLVGKLNEIYLCHSCLYFCLASIVSMSFFLSYVNNLHEKFSPYSSSVVNLKTEVTVFIKRCIFDIYTMPQYGYASKCREFFIIYFSTLKQLPCLELIDKWWIMPSLMRVGTPAIVIQRSLTRNEETNASNRFYSTLHCWPRENYRFD